MRNDGSSPTFVNTTVHANAASSGAGLYGVFATATLTNSIVWGNDGAEITDAFGASTTASRSIIDGGWPGAGNLADDPQFVGPADLRLQPASPARDAADTDSAAKFADDMAVAARELGF